MSLIEGKEYQEQAVNGTDICGPDEYIDADGLRVCAICHKPRQIRRTVLGREIIPSVPCRCQEEERSRKEAERLKREFQQDISRMKADGLQYESLYDCCFSNDNHKNPQMQYAYKYVEHWHEMKEKGMIEYDGHFIGTEITRKHREQGVRVAHVGSVRCGTPEFEEQDIDAYYTLPEEIFGKGEFYIVTAKGDSMIEAGIEEGDLVVVRKTAEACKGDIVVALLNGESTLKRLMIRQGKQFLHPENSALEDIPIGPEDEFYVQGVATHLIKHIASSIDRLK